MEKDVAADKQQAASSADTADEEDCFFKRGTEPLNVINEQMKHVRKGCLSDPPAEVVNLHRFNATTGKTCSARGTGSNEICWRHTNHLFDTPSMGFTRALMTVHNCFETSNDKKRVTRLGESLEETSRMEQLQALHGIASRCGFSSDEIPIKKPVFPRAIEGVTECVGFDHRLASHFDVDDANEDDEEATGEGQETELAAFLSDINLDDLTEEDITNEEMDCMGEDFEPVDIFMFERSLDVSICVPDTVENEKTFDKFTRVTQRPWVPFALAEGAMTFAEIDHAEHALFDEMKDSCDRGPRLQKT